MTARTPLLAPAALETASASKMPILSRLMVDGDQLMSALFLLALLLYLVQSVFSSGKSRRRLQLGAVLTLGTAIAIAVVASVIWFTR